MNEALQIICGLILLVGVFILSRFVMGWKIKNACRFILKDLENREALDSVNAVELPYVQKKAFNVGLRDYRPKALEYLIQAGIVIVSSQGKYYLKAGWKEGLNIN